MYNVFHPFLPFCVQNNEERSNFCQGLLFYVFFCDEREKRTTMKAENYHPFNGRRFLSKKHKIDTTTQFYFNKARNPSTNNECITLSLFL